MTLGREVRADDRFAMRRTRDEQDAVAIVNCSFVLRL